MGLHYVSIAAYMVSSILIMWSNKQVLATYNFPSTLALMLFQCSLSFIVFVVLHILGKVKIQILSYKRLKFHFPLLAITITNIFFGLKASAGMPAAMFTALRRLSILLCMYAQMYFLDQKLSATAVCSVWCAVVGASVASFHDFNFNFGAYVYVMLNNIFTAAQQILTQISIKNKIEKPTLVFYNSITLIIITTVGIVINKDMSKIYAFTLWSNGQFIIVIFTSCLMAILVNYSVVWCIEKNGALTLAVCGSLKNIVIGLLSCAGIIDNTYIFNWNNFLALQLAAISSLVYVYSKAMEIKREQIRRVAYN